MLDRIDIQRIAVAMFGASILFAACIVSGTSPAAATAPPAVPAQPCACTVMFLAK